ncbi:MAG: hypothetical protein HY906_15355 [Deltaproteobacteria bacterium]|nr:hypothetical protein [Deltaproteobacteria bacterium]
MTGRGLLALSLAAVLAACGTEVSLEADSEPIDLALVSEVPVTIATIPGRDPFRIVIDTASPLSAIDALGGTTGRTRLGEMRILRPDDPNVVRAILHDLVVVQAPLFQAGTGTPVAVAGVLGGDVLSHYAVRFQYGTGTATMTFTERDYDAGKPESNDELARAGLTVVHSHVLGGGAYDLGGDVESYGGSRLTVPACAVIGGRAVELTFLVATGHGPLVLGRAAAERRLGRAVPDGEADRLYVPAVAGGIAVLERGSLLPPGTSALAIVGDEHGSTSQSRSDFGGPCTQLFRHQTDLEGLVPPTDCPLGPSVGLGPNNSRIGAAYVQLCADAAVGYAVISDDEPLLASLRAELRPHLPEVDGLAGTEVLRHLVTELNYTNNRVILSCADGAPSCFSRPRTSFPD